MVFNTTTKTGNTENMLTLHKSRLNDISQALPVLDQAAAACFALCSVCIQNLVTTNKEKTTAVFTSRRETAALSRVLIEYSTFTK